MGSARPLTKEERKQVALNALRMIGKVLLVILLFPVLLLYYVFKAAFK